jgi:hypothetical protein
MRRTIHACFGFGASCLLASCSLYQAVQQYQEQQGRMTRSLNAYVGRSVADVALERGPPTNTIDLGPKKRGFEWQFAAARPEMAMPAPASGVAATLPPGEEMCSVSLVASNATSSPSLSDWIVESAQWKGASC